MRVAVIGLGGVGGYLAASFTKAGIDVIGFGRGEHLGTIQKHGLTVKEDSVEWNVAIDARELREAEGIFDVVLFCVKSYDLLQSYKGIAPCINDESLLISFANGVDNGDKLRDISHARVLEGAIYILSHIESPGVIRKKGKVFAAVFGGDKEAAEVLASLFEKAELRYKTVDDIKTALWKKYIFIAAFATLTSYYDKPIAYIYKEHYDETKEVLEEIAAVAKSYGINIDDEVQKALDTASKLPADASTSMHFDFQNKKRTELESLSGYIAKNKAVKTPLMEKMYQTLSTKRR
ncbi:MULTISPECIES: 2-dehydropantoate 2-reductase [Sulfurimonas]|uniref:ketopantoate reductase family protein n=1 Tax=Sulfurimonas TaxID=202746 RepID=UPI001264C55A|nr:2-dehydropantoate 2-reductase [Sulfurimonas indica]